DYDQDGDLDLYLTRASGLPDSLLENDGKGNFTDVTIERGLLAFSQTSAAAWLDYDRDGRLDLLVGRSDHPLELYHQTQTGSFQPVAWDLKLWVPRGVREIEVSDFSGDGYPDFILGLNGLTDRICKNEPAETWTDWRFPDVAAEAGLTVLRNSSGHFFDFDNDGVEDLLLLSEVSDRGSPVSLYRNEGEGRFRDISEEAGLDGITNAVSASTLDLDNDGFLDLILGSPALSPNRVLWNRGGYQFREVSVAAGGSFLDRPISFLSRDIDRNGAVDLLSLNEAGNLRWLEPIGDLDSWMRVRIAGNIPGTRITMIVRDHDWILHPFHRVFGTETEVTVGVGNASTVESLALTRPGSEEPEETLTKVSPNQLVELELTRSREPKKIEPVVETP
ncbi:MAG: VCBS repeat-containing protein, partial [Verrucomicrobiota bacterium]